jgi:hypothetical protein
MINSLAAAAHVMINKNADYRAGAARRTARATAPCPNSGAVGAAAPRCTACAGLTLGRRSADTDPMAGRILYRRISIRNFGFRFSAFGIGWIRFRLASAGDLVHLRRTAAGQGGKCLPLGNPGPGCMPTVGTAPRSGLPSTGREPHAIHGVTLPFAVILTAHRLQSPHPTARQTAQAFVGNSQARAQLP